MLQYRFECQDSCKGKCCSALGKGYVFLTKEDTNRLEIYLNQKPSEFSNVGLFKDTRFTHKESPQRFLKDSEQHCRFLKDGKCSVYSVRPTQCKTFPFWPELLHDAAWNALAEYCPGIHQGLEPENAVELLNSQKAADKEMAAKALK